MFQNRNIILLPRGGEKRLHYRVSERLIDTAVFLQKKDRYKIIIIMCNYL